MEGNWRGKDNHVRQTQHKRGKGNKHARGSTESTKKTQFNESATTTTDVWSNGVYDDQARARPPESSCDMRGGGGGVTKDGPSVDRSVGSFVDRTPYVWYRPLSFKDKRKKTDERLKRQVLESSTGVQWAKIRGAHIHTNECSLIHMEIDYFRGGSLRILPGNSL